MGFFDWLSNKKKSSRVSADSERLLSAIDEGNLYLVKELLIGGTDVNVVTNNGIPALMVATGARKGDIEMVKLLLDNGADINMPNNEGMTSLMFAVFRGHTEMVNLLILLRAFN